jgi:hypothetical protein
VAAVDSLLGQRNYAVHVCLLIVHWLILLQQLLGQSFFSKVGVKQTVQQLRLL